MKTPQPGFSSATTHQVQTTLPNNLGIILIAGLISLIPINSTTYSTVSLVIALASLALVVGYLLTTAPAEAFQYQQFQQHYRAFTNGTHTHCSMVQIRVLD